MSNSSIILNRSDTTRWTMRFKRASPLSFPRPLTLVSRLCTSRVSSKLLIDFSSGVGVVNFSTEVSARHWQSHARDVRSLVGSAHQAVPRLRAFQFCSRLEISSVLKQQYACSRA